MAIASQLPLDYKVTIVGEHLPGDARNKDWASPWAGACWVGVQGSAPRDQKLQIESLVGLWKLAQENPDSGLRISKVTEIMEFGSKEEVWFQYKVPGFRFLEEKELPEPALFGIEYTSVVISPTIFLPWMRARLETRDVRFERIERVNALSDLRARGHDILINASGASSKSLEDVKDTLLEPFRLQSIVVKSNFQEAFIYRGKNGYYFNIFGRPDGTAYIGGIKTLRSQDRDVHDEDRQTVSSTREHVSSKSDRQKLFDRGNKLLPSILPSSKPEDYDVLYDIATTYDFRSKENGGSRVEGESIRGKKVVHAYGQEAGGYTNSFGIARKVAGIVADLVYEGSVMSKI